MAKEKQYLERNIDVYHKHVNIWYFTIITVRENFIFNNIHEKNKITIRCFVKADMPLKEKGGIHQTELCVAHHVGYYDPTGS